MNYKNFWDRFFVTDGQKNIARVTEKLKRKKDSSLDTQSKIETRLS